VPRRARTASLRVAAGYLLFGAAWILAGEALLAHSQAYAPRFASAEVLKGLLFVLGSALLIFALTYREMRLRRLAEAELGRLAAARAESQKMEALGRLAAGVAHDFNNILGLILGWSKVLADEPRLTEEAREGIAHIRNAGESGARLVQQIRLFSLGGDGLPVLIDVSPAIQHLLPTLEGLVGPAVRTSAAIDTPNCRVRIPLSHLEQVLMNLVANAGDAMPDGGTLTIAARRAEAAPAAPAAPAPRGEPPAADRPGVEIVVGDTGHGMDAATAARCFEPFFSTKASNGHAGIGLATVYGIVRKAGGRVSVDSRPGAGSRFTVYLPLADDDSASQPAIQDAVPQ
jgi:two-component system, cell cycle sensor histidine kinase and response regulator CckA